MEIMVLPLHSPYILGSDFAKQELKKVVVRLGVELSLYVVQSMFLLYDDTRTTLWFWYKLWRGARSLFCPNSFLLKRLICVIHYVYFKYIKPKNGVYHRLARPTLRNYKDIIVSLDILVRILRAAEVVFACGQDFTASIEEQLKQAELQLRCGKAVSEANGFRREVI
ncbi:hypothetical protein Bca52824_009763 [Brassica carinata]|uniref:Uncharacterized protein n=1 Tax=Brassica carinata TaxID=52824 RepID=A0A8X7WD87_BRACI|nr:hypothetical protein Bca52824_009763 [Brassica carinata]